MNEIETLFYMAYIDFTNNYVGDYIDYIFSEIEFQKPIGIYKPDFILNDFIIEIDGHEYHKTKEQREKDYIRERYFQKLGYKIIRFTGTEVFLDASKCIEDVIEITAKYWLNKELELINQSQKIIENYKKRNK